MTNGWIDIKNTDMMLIMGGNPAENHPCGFKWAVEAKRNRDAKMIVVDPRFTRTASQADLFCRFVPAATSLSSAASSTTPSQNNRVAHEYLVNYTNAAFIIKDGFKLPEDGLYSGFDPATKTYDKSHLELRRGRQRDRQGRSRPVAGAPATQERRWQTSRRPALRRDSRQQHPQFAEGQGYQAQDRRARRPWAAVRFRLRRCRRMSPTIFRCSIRAASINC